jgi:hypothetical protein
MPSYRFPLRITTENYLAYYRGAAHQVVATCSNGEVIQFPASLLQSFVTPEGIRGGFELTCDEAHRGARIRRIGGASGT